MRTTLTLDPDVAALLKKTVARGHVSFKQAVNEALRRDFIETLQALNRAPDVLAIVLTGAGRCFCAGQDLREAAAMTAEAIPAWQGQQRAMYQAIRELDKPCIAAMNGAAAGAGFQVALCARLVFMGRPWRDRPERRG